MQFGYQCNTCAESVGEMRVYMSAGSLFDRNYLASIHQKV